MREGRCETYINLLEESRGDQTKEGSKYLQVTVIPKHNLNKRRLCHQSVSDEGFPKAQSPESGTVVEIEPGAGKHAHLVNHFLPMCLRKSYHSGLGGGVEEKGNLAIPMIMSNHHHHHVLI